MLSIGFPVLSSWCSRSSAMKIVIINTVASGSMKIRADCLIGWFVGWLADWLDWCLFFSISKSYFFPDRCPLQQHECVERCKVMMLETLEHLRQKHRPSDRLFIAKVAAIMTELRTLTEMHRRQEGKIGMEWCTDIKIPPLLYEIFSVWPRRDAADVFLPQHGEGTLVFPCNCTQFYQADPKSSVQWFFQPGNGKQS